MSTKPANDQERTAVQDRIEAACQTGTHIGAGYKHLGIDAEGFAHCGDTAAREVHRIDTETGRRERLTQYDEATLDAYIDHVAREVGWDTRRYVKASAFWEVLGDV